MSDEDQRTVAIVAIIAVVGVFGLLYIIIGIGFYTEYECVQFYIIKMDKMPPVCSFGDFSKTLLEFAALIIGVLAAVKVFLGKM
jgi:hypothetical protein